MKIAVITPYHDVHSPYLQTCLNSVAAQTYSPVLHVAVGDGCDLSAQLARENLHNIPLPARINDYGDSPRSIGVIYAFARGADAVMFLDSDNWYAPDHVAAMVAACRASGADVVTCRRTISHLDGRVLGLCPDSDGQVFCDTNCLLVTRNLAEEAGLWWLIPADMHVIDDRVVWDTLIHNTAAVATTDRASVYYRSAFRFHYDMFNAPAPDTAKGGEAIAELNPAIAQFQARARMRAKSLKWIRC